MITIEQVIEQCAVAAWTDAMNRCQSDRVNPSTRPDLFVTIPAIRALKAQYEGYRVIEPDSVIYKSIADNYAREPK